MRGSNRSSRDQMTAERTPWRACHSPSHVREVPVPRNSAPPATTSNDKQRHDRQRQVQGWPIVSLTPYGDVGFGTASKTGTGTSSACIPDSPSPSEPTSTTINMALFGSVCGGGGEWNMFVDVLSQFSSLKGRGAPHFVGSPLIIDAG